MEILIIPLCVSIITTLIFIHCHFKKYEFLSKLNDYLLFKKNLFNKKHYFPAGNKTVISYFFLNNLDITLFIMSCHINIINGLLNSNIFLFFIVIVVIPLMIIRLIYEFIVVPHSYKKKIYESQLQNINTPPYIQNTQFAQQPIQDIQQPSAPNNVIINNQTISTSEEQEFKFCSQCGTKYNATDDKCPNCGLQ